ncbi:MAG: hypothetical protein R3A47_03070 [Polyangiales bacterium]
MSLNTSVRARQLRSRSILDRLVTEGKIPASAADQVMIQAQRGDTCRSASDTSRLSISCPKKNF